VKKKGTAGMRTHGCKCYIQVRFAKRTLRGRGSFKVMGMDGRVKGEVTFVLLA